MLLGTRVSLSAFRLWFFGHLALLSHCTHLVPEPGIGPGRPEWARDCKSRLSASSSTRGPQAIGPFSAALRYLANNSERNILVSDGRRFPFVINPALFFLSLDFSRFLKTTENLVNRRHRSSERTQVISLVNKLLAYILRREFFVTELKNETHRVRYSQGRNFLVRVVGELGQWREVIENFVEMLDFVSHLDKFRLKFRPAINETAAHLTDGRPCLFEMRRIHAQEGILCL